VRRVPDVIRSFHARRAAPAVTLAVGTFERGGVQNNVDSAAFGSLYNGLITRVMLTLQLTAK